MNEMLKTILEMDKNAQNRVKEAEEYRRSTIASLSERKASIIEDETKKAIEAAARQVTRRKNEGEKNLTVIKEQNAKILTNMNRLYEKNADSWVDLIVRNAIK